MDTDIKAQDFLYYLREAGVNRIQSNVWHPDEQTKEFAGLENYLAEIEEYREKHEEIRFFMDELLAAKNADDDGLYWNALESLVFDIARCSIMEAGDLGSFMINYFLDDAYFTLKLEDGIYKVIPEMYTGDERQDPKHLVMAAKHNANYLWDANNNPNFDQNSSDDFRP